MGQVKLKIGGIHCKSCNELISDVLVEELKVRSVNFKENIATIDFDEKKIKLETIKKEIQSLGYTID